MKKKSNFTLILFSFLTALTFVIGGIFSPTTQTVQAATNKDINITIEDTSNYWRYYNYDFDSPLDSFDGRLVWTDGTYIYYGRSYYISPTTLRVYVNNLNITTNWKGDYVWYYEDNIYMSNLSTQLKFNKTTQTTSTVSWSGLTNFFGDMVWTDGLDYYYSYYSNSSSEVVSQYVLVPNSTTWQPVTFNKTDYNGITSPFLNIYGDGVWTDGVNTYYSYHDNGFLYKFNKDTLTFEYVNSYGRDPRYIWTDGLNVYYSNGSTQEIFNSADGTWSPYTWSFYNNNAWSFDGDDVFILDDLVISVYNNRFIFNTYLIYQKSFDAGKLAGYQDGYTAGYNAGLNEGSTSDSYNAGYTAGYNAGIATNSGYSDGYDTGYNQGYNQGYGEGQQIGYNSGRDDGYNNGYNDGYEEGIETGSDYSFLGLISATIDAPIKAFTGLFDFEIFGTNIKNLLLALFTASVIIVIVKLCLGGK